MCVCEREREIFREKERGREREDERERERGREISSFHTSSYTRTSFCLRKDSILILLCSTFEGHHSTYLTNFFNSEHLKSNF